jgi:CRAL/TRIO domain
MRAKGLYFVNVPSFVHAVLMMAKPLIKSSHRKMLNSFPSPMDAVFEIVPKEMFPKEISGNGMTIEEMRGKYYNVA